MAISVTEILGSGETQFGSRRSHERRYAVRGTTSELAAIQALASFAPRTFTDLVALDFRVEPITASVWNGIVTYGEQSLGDEEEPGGSSASFDAAAGSQHIKHSLKTVGRYVPDGFMPADFKQAIGWDGEQNQGVDKVVPTFSFSETHHLPRNMVTQTYVRRVARLVGRVNSGRFRGFDAGEVLFLGLAGSLRSVRDDWELTFKFAMSPNETNLLVGDIVVARKDGWDYLWIYDGLDTDASSYDLRKTPRQANVERIYERADFRDLGIGVL